MTSTPDFLTVLMTMIGAGIMCAAIFMGVRVRWTSLAGMNWPWRICNGFMILFLGGHLTFLAFLLSGRQLPMEQLTGFVFAGGAVFALIVVEVVSTFADRAQADMEMLRDWASDMVKEINERREAEKRLSEQQSQIKQMAQYDMLTGLPNRLLLDDRLSQLIKQARRHRQMISVLCLGIDRFKTINDTFGYEVGDQLLQMLAERLRVALRDSDTIARIGGDEFIVLLPNLSRAEDAGVAARKVEEAIAPPCRIDNHEIYPSVCMGIAIYPHDGEDASSLLRNANSALNQAKERGRSNCQLYSPAMNLRALERLSMENDLRGAIERQEMLLYYQPVLALPTGTVTGVEALLRWQHPNRGLVSPAAFIPLAEETGLIHELGRWALRTACRQARLWHESGFLDLRMAVNLSPRQFTDDNLIEVIRETIAASGAEPTWLELEITESTIMHNVEAAIAILTDLHQLGIRISVDDFGTGHSSLSQIKKFPFQTLKIDRSFIRDLATDPDDAAIIKAIVAMARTLRLEVVAEGVETEEQLNFLQELHCDRLQGFLFSKPLPTEEATRFLASSDRMRGLFSVA